MCFFCFEIRHRVCFCGVGHMSSVPGWLDLQRNNGLPICLMTKFITVQREYENSSHIGTIHFHGWPTIVTKRNVLHLVFSDESSTVLV